MSTISTDRVLGLNEFFAASEARVDRWRTLNRVAKALAGTGARAACVSTPRNCSPSSLPWRSSAAIPDPD